MAAIFDASGLDNQSIGPGVTDGLMRCRPNLDRVAAEGNAA